MNQQPWSVNHKIAPSARHLNPALKGPKSRFSVLPGRSNLVYLVGEKTWLDFGFRFGRV